MGTKTRTREAGENPTFPLPRECLCLNYYFIYKKIGFFVFNFRNSHSNETSLFQIIRIDMKLANEDVSMLAFTSEQITAPFLLAEMVYCIVFIHYVIPQNVSC